MSISKTIKIGEQVWMTQNLNVNTYNNGDIILYAASKEQWYKYAEQGMGAWRYLGYKESNARQYGRQYNWYAVIDPRGIAPQGFHIPDHEDWSKLIYFLGGFKKEEMVVTKLTNPAGLSLFMDADYWNTTEIEETTVGFLGVTSGLSFPNLPTRVKCIDLCPRWTDPHEAFERPFGLGKDAGGFIRCLSVIEEDIGDIYWIASEAGSTANDDFM